MRRQEGFDERGYIVNGDVVDAVRGNLVTNSHIAALMRRHGVSTIYTADRGFRRFPGIIARDPYFQAAGPAIP